MEPVSTGIYYRRTLTWPADGPLLLEEEGNRWVASDGQRPAKQTNALKTKIKRWDFLLQRRSATRRRCFHSSRNSRPNSSSDIYTNYVCFSVFTLFAVKTGCYIFSLWFLYKYRSSFFPRPSITLIYRELITWLLMLQTAKLKREKKGFRLVKKKEEAWNTNSLKSSWNIKEIGWCSATLYSL